MNRRLPLLGLLLALALPSERAVAADPRYPDWPCAQAKVPDLSIAAVWAGPPLDEAEQQWKDDPKIGALVPRLAARRVPIDEAEKTITDFLAGAAADKVT